MRLSKSYLDYKAIIAVIIIFLAIIVLILSYA